MRPTRPTGKSAGGADIPQPQCPTLVGQAEDLAATNVDKTNAFRARVIHERWGGGQREDRFAADSPPSAVPRRLRIYGFIENCQRNEIRYADGFLLNIAPELPDIFSESPAGSDGGGEIADVHCGVRTLYFTNLMCSETPAISFRMCGARYVGF